MFFVQKYFRENIFQIFPICFHHQFLSKYFFGEFKIFFQRNANYFFPSFFLIRLTRQTGFRRASSSRLCRCLCRWGCFLHRWCRCRGLSRWWWWRFFHCCSNLLWGWPGTSTIQFVLSGWRHIFQMRRWSMSCRHMQLVRLHDQRQVRLILSGVGDKVAALLFASHRERFERRRGWWCCFLNRSRCDNVDNNRWGLWDWCWWRNCFGLRFFRLRLLCKKKVGGRSKFDLLMAIHATAVVAEKAVEVLSLRPFDILGFYLLGRRCFLLVLTITLRLCFFFSHLNPRRVVTIVFLTGKH